MGRAEIDDVLVLVHAGREKAVRASVEIVAWLQEHCRRVRVEPDLRAYCNERRLASREHIALDVPPELLVVLGGDGSILQAAQAFADSPVPTLGVNFGHVGFLASTPETRWRETLASVFDGEARVEDRMRLCVEWMAKGKLHEAIALNEVVLQRGSHQPMMRASMHVGSDYVTTYRADGLILGTPSGSTAYSLSAGGPIVLPGVKGIVVTPICSQALSNRPLVLNANDEVRVRLNNAGGTTGLVVDGHESFGLSHGQEIRVSTHPVGYPLIAMPDLDPFRRLRERLGWTGGPKNVESEVSTEIDGDDPFPPRESESGPY